MRLFLGISNQVSYTVDILSGLLASWKMDEVSGNLVDEVSSQTITALGGWVYSQSGPSGQSAIEVSNRIQTPVAVSGLTEFSIQLWFKLPDWTGNNSLWSCDNQSRGFSVYVADFLDVLGLAWDESNFPKFGINTPASSSAWHNLVINVYNSGADLVVEASFDGGALDSITLTSASIATHCNDVITLNSADSNGSSYDFPNALYGPFHIWDRKLNTEDIAFLQTNFYDDF